MPSTASSKIPGVANFTFTTLWARIKSLSEFKCDGFTPAFPIDSKESPNPLQTVSSASASGNYIVVTEVFFILSHTFMVLI